jgi:hypothetical protein
MSTKTAIYVIILSAGLLNPLRSAAQVSLSLHLDAGKNNVSEGLFLQTAAFGEFHHEKNGISGGFQVDLKGPGSTVLSGSLLKASREFSIGEFPFKIQGLFVYNRFSELLYEYDWGILAGIDRRHFEFNLGTNFRTYGISRLAQERYDIYSHKKIHENWNLMYRATWNLKPAGNDWNAGLTLTNTDYFIIEQETNPVLYLKGTWKVSSPVTLFLESWYKSSGAFNLRVNHFGYFFRTGVLWEINH